MTMLPPVYSLLPILPPSQIPLSCMQVPSVVDIDAYGLCFSNVISKLRPFQSICSFFQTKKSDGKRRRRKSVKDINSMKRGKMLTWRIQRNNVEQGQVFRSR